MTHPVPRRNIQTFTRLALAAALLASVLMSAFAASAAEAAPRCFGQPAKVLKRPGAYHLDRHEAVFINAPVRIIGRGDNRICGKRHRASVRLGKGTTNLVRLGAGDDLVRVDGPTAQTRIHAGSGDNRVLVNQKASRHVVVTGNGNDRIRFHPRAKASSRVVSTGLGNDRVQVLAKGNTTATLGPRANPRGLPNDNHYWGGRSNDAVRVHHGSNVIHGNNGSDTVHSLGSAESVIHGGNGTDFIHSNGSDEIYGGRGQDRILADRGTSTGPIYADGGPGDDTIHGTDHGDTLLAPTGGNKISGHGGDDLIRVGDGPDVIEGGSGANTLSFAAHTPPGWRDRTGVKIDLERGLAHGSSLGSGFNRFSGIAEVISSSFDDWIITDPKRRNVVHAGIGDDEIDAHDGDVIDAGPGRDSCTGGSELEGCGGSGRDASQPLVDVSPDGVMVVLGTNRSEQLRIGRRNGDYVLSSSRAPRSAGDHCSVSGDSASCSVPHLSRILVYSQAGSDEIAIDGAVPGSVSTTLDGGPGANSIRGGNTNDYIASDGAGSTLSSLGGVNIFQVSDTGQTEARGGRGPDVFKIPNPCPGHEIAGGGGKDGLVFAQSDRPVEVNLGRGYAKWRDSGNCNPTRVAPDIQGAEGTRYADLLIGSPRARNGFLGRQGADTFYTRHRTRDSIITGPGGRSNRVLADPGDRVVWGWGLASVGG